MNRIDKLDAVNKICIVDDSMVSLTVARDMLKDSYEVYASTSAEEFFKIIEIEPPDLILLDVGMPKISGYDAIKILKEDRRFADIPVIFLTAKADKESELKGFELGAVDYISKPFHMPILKARINTHLTIVKQRRIIEQISLTDVLTKIPNRRFFNGRLAGEWSRAVREKHPLGIMMIDADNFKDFNDLYGHQQGDVTLQVLAHVLNTSLRRGTDFVARWGGEEFAAILPNTAAAGIFKIAEIIRLNVEKTAIPHIEDASRGLSITISIGGASMIPTMLDTVEDFMKKADSALYEAKQAGKNKVCMFDN
jgi:diguanylate cyclase (GGDEF)-like protein